jgi:hypothetical protein
MSNGPIANYIYMARSGGRPLGYNAVGPGWKHLLELLDGIMVQTIENAVSNATVALPEYRDAENTAEATVKVLQIKEKFGGLRVYFETDGMSRRFTEYLNGAASFAMGMSLQTCEKCGSRQGAETRKKKEAKYGRVLSLCEGCHEERDHLPEGQWFELGNGDKT